MGILASLVNSCSSVNSLMMFDLVGCAHPTWLGYGISSN